MTRKINNCSIKTTAGKLVVLVAWREMLTKLTWLLNLNLKSKLSLSLFWKMMNK